jgi:AMMECR1 domain-containing protein
MNSYQKYMKYKHEYDCLKKQIGGSEDLFYEIENQLMILYLYFIRNIHNNKLPYSKEHGKLKYVGSKRTKVLPEALDIEFHSISNGSAIRNIGNISDILYVLTIYPQMLHITNIMQTFINYNIDHYLTKKLDLGSKSFLLISMIYYQKVFNTNVYDADIEHIKNDIIDHIKPTGEIICDHQEFFAGEALHSLNIYEEYVGVLNFQYKDKIIVFYENYYREHFENKDNNLLPFFANWQLQGFLENNQYTEKLINHVTQYMDDKKHMSIVEYACALEGLTKHLTYDEIKQKYNGHIKNLCDLIGQASENTYDNMRFDELGHCISLFVNITRKRREPLLQVRNVPIKYIGNENINKNNVNVHEGIFVTLYANDKLAGCIGSFYNDDKKENLITKIINQTTKSMNDSRFMYDNKYFRENKITSTITILGSIKRYNIQTINDAYIPGYHGIILYCDNEQLSTYLPSVMIEQGWITDNIQLRITDVVESLKRKAGVRDCSNVEIGLYAGYEITST